MSLSVGVGLISGIDFNDLVERLMEVERRPITQQETHRTQLEQRQQAYATLDLRINALRDALRQIDTVLDFSTKQTSVSDDAALSATANSSALDGSFSLEVLQLASNERRASQGVATSDATAIASGEGTFRFRVGAPGSAATEIQVDASTTLAELRDAINNAEGGVRATIINDGTATNPCRLALIANETGAEHSITILNNDTILDFTNPVIEDPVADESNNYTGTLTVSSLNGFSGTTTRNVVIEVTTAGAVGEAKFRVSLDGGATWSADDAFTATAEAQDIAGGEDIRVAFSDDGSTLEAGDRFTIDAFNPLLQKARDAIVKVDGISLSRSSNTMTDVVSGMTLTVRKTTSSPVTVTVATDKSGIAGKIGEFVNAYNALVGEVRNLTQYDVTSQTGQPLYADPATRSLSTTLAGIVSGGVMTANGLLSPAAIGIHSARAANSDGTQGRYDGTLAVDQTVLSKAVEDNFESVKKLFAMIGESSSQAVGLVSAQSGVAAGSYSIRVSQAAERAEISGGQVIAPTGLALAERLTFTVGRLQLQINLNAGDTISTIVERLNSGFREANAGLEAVDQSGELTVRSVQYGANQSFSVVSNRAGAGQTGFGLTVQSDTGANVAGTINGRSAIGQGQILRGAAGTGLDGLQLLVTATSPTTATVTVSRGVASQILGQIENYTDSSDGILTLRREGVASDIERINERIQELEDRMTKREASYRQQFTHLETILAQFQSQSEFLSAQLAQISQLRTQ